MSSPAASASFPLVVLIQFCVLALAGVYRFIWRYVGIREARTILFASVGAAVPALALRLGLPESLATWRVPLSVIVIDAMLAFLGVLGLRLMRRVLFEYREKRSRSSRAVGTTRRRALLVGAGRAGVLAAREIFAQDDMGLEVEGFVDDDPGKAGAQIHGLRVLGTTADLPRLVRELEHRPGRHHDCSDHATQDPAHHRYLPKDPGQAAHRAGALRDPAGQGADNAHPDRRGRGPARPRAGAARREANRPVSGRQDGHGHGRWRIDRLGAFEADRPFQTGLGCCSSSGRSPPSSRSSRTSFGSFRAFRSCRSSPTLARSDGCGRSSPSTILRSSCTRRRTSTCR